MTGDRRYTACWLGIAAAAAAVEAHALANNPGKRATLSAHAWWLLGQRWRVRWVTGGLVWLWLTRHLLWRKPC